MIIKRRRAQNRASQAAFRARQLQRTKNLEEYLAELEQKHQDLNQSYESLQLEHSTVKQELEALQTSNINHKSISFMTSTYQSDFGSVSNRLWWVLLPQNVRVEEGTDTAIEFR